MLRLEPTRKAFTEAGALHANVNLFGFWDEHAFFTKSGDTGVVLRLRGVDYESLDHAARDLAVKRLEAALRVFDEKTRIYQFLFKDQAEVIPPAAHPNPLVQAALEQRDHHLAARARDLYKLDIYFVVLREGAAATASALSALKRMPQDIMGVGRDLLRSFASEKSRVLVAEQIETASRQLQHGTRSFMQQLEDLVRIELLPAADAFGVLYRTLNFDHWKRDNAKLLSTEGLDLQLCDTEIEAHRGYLRAGDQYLKVLTLKDPPSETWPLILRDLLEIKASFTIVTEWQAVDNGKARKLIQSRRRHFHNSKTSFMSNLSLSEHKGPADELIDDSKQAAVSDLGECLTAIAHDGKYFGEFSLSCVVHGTSLKDLDRIVPEFVRAFTKYDGGLLEERYNLLNAFFATVPGNAAFNLRRLHILNTNYADLSLLFTVHTGEPANRHLSSEYLAVLETDQATPYYLNLHQQDVAHTLILGATGSGKSFLLNFLIQSLQKYDPQTYIFDLGGSFENITRIFGGSYLNVGPADQAFTINPFSLAPEKANLDFLYAFLKVLIEGNGKHELSGIEERSLYAAVERMYKLDPKTRTLTNLAAMIGPLSEHLQRWTRAGQFGHVFDNADDTLTLRPFQTFNFDTSTIYPDVLEPLLFYILHRASDQPCPDLPCHRTNHRSPFHSPDSEQTNEIPFLHAYRRRKPAFSSPWRTLVRAIAERSADSFWASIRYSWTSVTRQPDYLFFPGITPFLQSLGRARSGVSKLEGALADSGNLPTSPEGQMSTATISTKTIPFPTLVDTREAAKILGRSVATLKRWRYEGTGPNWIELQGRVSYDVSVLLEFIRGNTRVASVRAAMEEIREAV